MFPIKFQDLYDNVTAIIIIVIILVILFMFWYILPQINNMLVFRPYKATQKEFNKLATKYSGHVKQIDFEAEDGTKLSGMLVNNFREPKWTDIIFLYSHGNAFWLGGMFGCKSLKFLSKYGSIFAYDYRGYGLSDGSVSEEGCYDDIMGAWNYLTKSRGVSSDKIIIFGHSLGSAISTHLITDLVKSNSPLPKAVILWAPLSSARDMADRMLNGLSLVTIAKFSNMDNLQEINGEIPVVIMHSKDDETVPYEQGIKLKENTISDFIEISGNHCQFHYNDKVKSYLKKLI